MKNKITILAIMLSVALGVFPSQLLAQEYDYSSSYNYDTSVSSGYDYTSPSVSSYDYTSPTVSAYDYTSPTNSAYNYTSPTVSSYDYTSPSVSSYNYTSPTVSAYDYTSPTVSSYNYTSPTVSSYDYTSPAVSSYNFTNPTTYSGTVTPSNGYTYTPSQTPSYTYTPGYSYTPSLTSVSTGGSISPTGGIVFPTNTISTGGGIIFPTGNNVINTTNNVVCSDGRAPTNGSCVRTTTINTTNNVVCSDGYAPTNGSCNRTTTINTTNNTICSDGHIPTNGSCVRTTTINTTNNTICSDGQAPTNGSCLRTNTIPTTINTICSDGQAPFNGSCIRTTTVNTICSDGSLPVNGSCVRVTTIPTVYYQSCWDGSRIPTTSVCPAQYKTCPNGTSIPVSQACYVTTTPIYVPPQVVKFNNVVTSVATEISKTSGRCNGIGLVANGAQSTGWFEYGETSSLGRTTATANIGSANTAPFSNVLTNLKPSTRYYCRAVMHNQYGLVKGEIVSFMTKSTVVTYVKPVVTRPVVKTPVKTNVITCSDGSTVKTKSTSSAMLINQGEKLLAVQIEKIDGNLSSGEVIRYKVSYKNLADTRLSGILLKITLPQETIFAGATAGNYDAMSRTLTLSQDTIDPYTEGVILITANVQKDAAIGKTIVTNVYAVYTVPGTKTQDEVTAYVVGSITPAITISNQDTGAKKVIGASSENKFMPNSLIEWLALLAILFIIFILGRSVYASYKDDENHHKH